MRQKLFTVVRMIIHYGKHLGGYKPVDGQPNYPEDLARITYLEDKPEIDVQPLEIELDKVRALDEMENLGPIGFKTTGVEYLKFGDAVNQVDKTCRELAVKLYTGENIKYLVGDEKIPEYLSIFLQNMHR